MNETAAETRSNDSAKDSANESVIEQSPNNNSNASIQQNNTGSAEDDASDAINMDELINMEEDERKSNRPSNGDNNTNNNNGSLIGNWWQSLSTTIRTLSTIALDENEPTDSIDPSLLSLSDSTSTLFPGLFPQSNSTSSSSPAPNVSSPISIAPSSSSSSISSQSQSTAESTRWPSSLRSLFPLSLVPSNASAPIAQSLSPPEVTLNASTSAPSSPLSPASEASEDTSTSSHHKRKSHFERILNEDPISLSRLQKVSWSGIPNELRSHVWKLLLGYAPLHHGRRQDAITKKRTEYYSYLKHYVQHFQYSNSTQSDSNSMSNNTASDEQTTSNSSLSSPLRQIESSESKLLRQVLVDIPRTCPTLAYFHCPSVQKSFERILFIYGTRHPATNYVQGMNDILCAFYAVFVQEYCEIDLETATDCPLTHEQRLAVEADSYWCFSALLEKITDHYTFAQPGIQKMIFELSSSIATYDPPLYDHLHKQDVKFLHFAFRWMNCLLIRELPLQCAVRLFDTYFANGDLSFAVSKFHVYVCAALLISFSGTMKEKDFAEILLFLQKLPTDDWHPNQIDAIVAQAYVFQQKDESSGGKAEHFQ